MAQLLEQCKYKGIVYITSLFNKTVYHFVNTFTLHGLFSAEFHDTNTAMNVKGSVVHGPE